MKARPRPRPKVTVGRTVKLRVGCGSIYVTINEDASGLAEVFVKLGRSGGCGASQTEAIGRLVSLALRSGIEPEEVIKQLKGIRCPYTMWDDGVPITSCADAVAKALEAHLRGELDRPSAEGTRKLNEFTEKHHETGKNPGNAQNPETPAACPECGSRLTYVEGCATCPSCGFSKCG